MSSSAMSARLAGKTILITGASSGIGRATALEFARTSPKDLKLIVTARRLKALTDLAGQIKQEFGEGVDVWPVQLDVSNPEDVARFVENLPEGHREVDVLVNNAGLVKGVDKAPHIKADDIKVMIDTNVTGLINMTQAILPIYQARPDGGHGDIINVGSIAGRDPYPGGSIYCATKAAVRAFTDSLRKEAIDSRIRVMEIDPGQVETEFSVVRFGGDKEKADAVYKGCEPLTPEDIAEVVVFAAGRRENVVLADTLIFPSHQKPDTDESSPCHSESESESKSKEEHGLQTTLQVSLLVAGPRAKSGRKPCIFESTQARYSNFPRPNEYRVRPRFYNPAHPYEKPRTPKRPNSHNPPLSSTKEPHA